MAGVLIGIIAVALGVFFPTTEADAEDAPGFGFFDATSGRWLFDDGKDFYFGIPGDLPMTCDWDGDGTDTVGLYRRQSGFLYLRQTNTQGVADLEIFFGIPEDLPVCGDWDGDGVDTIGVYRPSQGRFYLRNSNTQGFADIAFYLTGVTGVPIAGDFNGDGIDTVGLWNDARSRVAFAGSTNNAPPISVQTFGAPGDRMIVGDWDLNGSDSVGVFRPSTQILYLMHNDSIENRWSGLSGSPVAGNYDGTGGGGGDPALAPATPTIDWIQPYTDHVAVKWQPQADAVGGFVIETRRGTELMQRVTPAGDQEGPWNLWALEPDTDYTLRMWAVGDRGIRSTTVVRNFRTPSESQLQTAIPVYDTAWELPSFATLSDADTYFRHLSENGFAGSWMAYFNHINTGIDGYNANGDWVATGGWSEQFALDPDYAEHMRGILDAAERYDQKVGFVMIWAQRYVNNGALNRDNSYTLGQQLGELFGDHPAIEHWVAGGDNFGSVEDGAIWANMVSGLREAGASQPVGYHPPAIPGSTGHLRFVNEWWVDFIAPQTGHCQGASTTHNELKDVVNATSKPVYAGELRYEDINPSWCSPPGGSPVPPSSVIEDIQAAHTAGVSAIIYGHNERWQWGEHLNGGSNTGSAGALGSLGSPGEQLMMDYLRQQAQ